MILALIYLAICLAVELYVQYLNLKVGPGVQLRYSICMLPFAWPVSHILHSGILVN